MAANEMRLRFVLDAIDRVTGPMKDIMGGSSRAAKALKQTATALKALEDQQKKIGSYTRQKSALEEQTAALKAARAKQAELKAAIEATSSPTKTLQRQYASAGRTVARLEAQTDTQSGSLNRLQGELREAGIDTTRLARHETELAEKIRETSARMKEQQQRLDKASAARRTYGRRSAMAQKVGMSGAAMLGGGMAIALPARAATEAAAEYESKMTDIAQKSDMSRAAAKKLGSQLRDVATRTNQYAEQIQDGMDVLTGKGLDATTAAKMMAPIGKAATAYKAEMSDLSAASFAVFDNLKVPINQVALALDAMAKGGKDGSFELKDMAQFFPALSAGYTALGQKGVHAVADLTAALEIATKGAGDASQAANNVQNLINKINSRETVQNFAKFGIDLPKAMKKAYAEGKTPIEAISELTKKALGGNMEKLSYLFNDMQVQAALRPLMQNMKAYRQIREDAMHAAGTVDRDFAERMNDAKEKTRAERIAVQNLGRTVGTLLLPTITTLEQKISSVANGFSDWAGRHPKLAKALVLITALGGGLLLILGGLGIAAGFAMQGWAGIAFALTKLGPVLSLVSGGFRLLATGVRIATAAMIANPILAAVMAIAVAAYLIYRNWDRIGPWLAGVWEKIKAIFMAGVAFVETIPGRMLNIGKAMVQGIWLGIAGAKSWLMGKLTALANLLPAPIRKALGIHSPSRVFAGIGGHMMAGLDQGIRAGSRAPLARVGAVSGKMIRAMAVIGSTSAVMAAPVPPTPQMHPAAEAGQMMPPQTTANSQIRLLPVQKLPESKSGAMPATPRILIAGHTKLPDVPPQPKLQPERKPADKVPAHAAARGQENTPAPNVYHITINTKGDKPQDIARAVRTTIEQMQREDAGRTFRDE